MSLYIVAMTKELLISNIEDFAKRMNIAPATVTSRAVGNSRLYHRLKAGKSCTLDVAERIHAFIADNPPPVADHSNNGAAA